MEERVVNIIKKKDKKKKARLDLKEIQRRTRENKKVDVWLHHFLNECMFAWVSPSCIFQIRLITSIHDEYKNI